MKAFAVGIKCFLQEDEGATMVEYGLMAALIAVVCVTAVALIGTELDKVFDKVGNCLKDTSTC